jgi:hypothetical protein
MKLVFLLSVVLCQGENEQLNVMDVFHQVEIPPNCKEFFTQQFQELSAQCGIDATQFSQSSLLKAFDTIVTQLPSICTQNCIEKIRNTQANIRNHPCADQEVETEDEKFKIKEMISASDVILAAACVQTSDNQFCLAQQRPFLAPAMVLSRDLESLMESLFSVITDPRFFCTECLFNQIKAIGLLPVQEGQKSLITNANDIVNAYPAICAGSINPLPTPTAGRIQRRYVHMKAEKQTEGTAATPTQNQTAPHADASPTGQPTVPVATATPTQPPQQ